MRASGGVESRGHVGMAERRGCTARTPQMLAVALAGLLAWTLGGSAEAETLREALAAAYKFNPRLDAAGNFRKPSIR